MKKKIKVVTIIGTRPEIIRLSEVIKALDKDEERKFIKEKIVEVDGENIHFYETRQFPEIVGLFEYLDLVSKSINSYNFYFGGPTNYFNKEGNMND